MIHHTVWVRVTTKTDLLAQQWGKVNRPMHAARFGWIEYGISMDSRSAKQVLHAGITTKKSFTQVVDCDILYYKCLLAAQRLMR